VRYRPKRLKDLVGQEAATGKLQGMLKKKQLPGSLLITGSTGCGKTTLSQMIARYVNCETMEACGKCQSCKLKIDTHPDYEQINCAEKGGVDDIRGLIARSRNRPRMGNVRIFHLDECHKLSAAAAEALLVPLETPAEQTLFILSTTDPQQLKQTIKNRCTSINLQLVPAATVKGRLTTICEKEGLKIPDLVLDRIVELGAGYMRDSVKLLESCQIMLSNDPKMKAEALIDVVNQDAMEGQDKGLEDIVINTLVACLALNLKGTAKFLTDLKADSVGFTQKACWTLKFLIDQTLHGKHPNVWWTPLNQRFKKAVEASVKGWDAGRNILTMTSLLHCLVNLRQQLVSGGVGSIEAATVQATLCKWVIDNKKAKE
jgi:DNA polymerase III subunit gamma/tau